MLDKTEVKLKALLAILLMSIGEKDPQGAVLVQVQKKMMNYKLSESSLKAYCIPRQCTVSVSLCGFDYHLPLYSISYHHCSWFHLHSLVLWFNYCCDVTLPLERVANVR